MMIKTIDEFPSYVVSDDGQVFNSKGIRLKQEVTRNGYKRVSLSKPGASHKRMLVHRLVASAFIPNEFNLPQVNHINEDKSDNRACNLEWCTPIENLSHSNIIEKASIAKYTDILCETTGERFDSVKSAAEKYGLHHSNIVACCNGRRKTTGSKAWRYMNDKD